MNTRQYPRTLLQAFGPDANSANPIQRWDRANGPADVITAVVLGLLLAYGAYQWFTL